MSSVFAGLDWASRLHAVCVIDERGTVCRQWEVAHDADGLRDLLRSLRALHVQRIAIERPSGLLVDALVEAGFEVVSMEPIDVPFDQASHISPEMIYVHLKKLCRRNPKADGIYIQGSAWRVERVVETLEQDLGLPVVHANIARAWEIQKRLYVNQPLKGFGRLYAELPPLPE